MIENTQAVYLFRKKTSFVSIESYLKEGVKKRGVKNKKEFLSIEFWQYRHRGTFIGTGIGTADLKKKYRTTGTAVDFESTASKPGCQTEWYQ